MFVKPLQSLIEKQTGAAIFKTLRNETMNYIQSRKKLYAKMPIHGFCHNAFLRMFQSFQNRYLKHFLDGFFFFETSCYMTRPEKTPETTHHK